MIRGGNENGVEMESEPNILALGSASYPREIYAPSAVSAEEEVSL